MPTGRASAIDAFYLRPPRHVRRPTSARARRSSPARSGSIASSRWTTSTSRRPRCSREYLHVPGMGETTGAAFRDKLAMRARARAARHPLPRLRARREPRGDSTSGRRACRPWVLKPRSQAAAIGIKKIGIRRRALADARRARRRPARNTSSSSSCPATSITSTRWYSIGASCSPRRAGYGTPPMAVAHEGGIFVTRTLVRRGPDGRSGCKAMNARILDVVRAAARRVAHGVHPQPQRPADRTSWKRRRVSAARISSTSSRRRPAINLWREWAKIEIAGEHGYARAAAVEGRVCRIVLYAGAAGGAST